MSNRARSTEVTDAPPGAVGAQTTDSRAGREAGPARIIQRYSRFVARAKYVLPLVASVMLLMLAAWPYLSAGLAHVDAALFHLAKSQLKDLRMVKPRFTGVDRDNRPYTLTAEAARQNNSDTTQSDALIALEQPKADLLTKEGNWVIASAATGLYQFQTHFLDLFGGVTLMQDKGFTFHTKTARLDLNAGEAEGHEPVDGNGPSGTIEAEGFKVLKKGDIIVFTGASHMVLNGAHGDGQ